MIAFGDDLAGDWTVRSTSLLDDGSIRYEFVVHLRIEKRDTGLFLSMETAKSRSISQVVGISQVPEGTLLVTSFVADPDHEATASHDFFGMVRYVFAPGHQDGRGVFLNYNGRFTHGTLTLTRGAPDQLDVPAGYAQVS